MKKKKMLLLSLLLTVGTIASSLVLLQNSNLFIKAQSEDQKPHQIILTAENSSLEKESLYTKYFKLHKDNATKSGYSIDSTPEECFVMADGDTGAAGDSICWGEANPASGTYASLVVTIPLKNLQSFTSVVLRGKFYRDYWSDEVNEIQFGSEKYLGNEFYVHISHQYREIILEEIEINYTCA